MCLTGRDKSSLKRQIAQLTQRVHPIAAPIVQSTNHKLVVAGCH